LAGHSVRTPAKLRPNWQGFCNGSICCTCAVVGDAISSFSSNGLFCDRAAAIFMETIVNQINLIMRSFTIKTTAMILLLLCVGYAGVLAQNVGIGSAIPSEKLTIGSGNLLFENSAKGIILNGADNAMITRGFDPFTSGKNAGLGRWGLFMEPNVLTMGIPNVFGKRMAVSAFDANSTVAKEILVVAQSGNVGINVSDPQWMLDVNGGMQLKGRLFVSGSSGTAGQVLTSNFLSPPSWQTLSTAYDNNIRFSFTASNPTATSGDLTIGTRYNTNPTAVSVSTTSITFNQTGIYHFDMAISGRLDYASALSFNPSFGINFSINNGVGAGNNPVGSCELLRKGTFITYSGTAYASTDFYITAGQTLYVSFDYNAPVGASEIDTFGYIRGYLINN